MKRESIPVIGIILGHLMVVLGITDMVVLKSFQTAVVWILSGTTIGGLAVLDRIYYAIAEIAKNTKKEH
ncbi:MAG: hypothetical protein WCT40_01540 [Candidatus Magasanikbacteria bacterium]|jgi:hypothetical protein